jgi:CheY-like chemotaxis protein
MRSRSVLVVEDEAFVAIELASLLQRSGYRVLGPASTVQQALALLEDERPDAALLDLNLGSERVTAVAIELKSRNVPFVLVTGFADVREPELRFAPMLRKPVSDDGEVRRLLEAMLSPHSS